MKNLSLLLTDLRAAIAVVAARERGLTALLVLVYGRICRISTRLERLVALWRAGSLPVARASQAGRVRAKTERVRLPAAPGWLGAQGWEVRGLASQLAHLLSGAEMVEFLAAVPQAGRVLRPLCQMLGIGVAPAKVRRPVVVWGVPASVVVPAGLVLGPDGRFLWV